MIQIFLVVDLLLVAAHVLCEVAVRMGLFGDTDLWHLGREQNIPTWYSSTKLATVGFTLFCVAILLPRVRWIDNIGVVLGAAIFILLAIDETASVHERIGDLVNTDDIRSHFIESGIWPLLCAPALVVAVVIVYRLGRRLLTRQVTLLFATGLVVLLGGAVGLEMAANLVTPYSLAYHGLVVAEESLEMLGATILLWGAIRFAQHHGVSLSIQTPHRSDDTH